MKYNILITGGAGYIGSLLTEKLLDEKHNITVYDNFSFNQSSLITCVIEKISQY